MAIPGSVVAAGKLVTPGGAQGPTGPNAVSTDAGNLATLGSDGLVLVPQSTIWNQRLRSFNAIGNPNFEVDQRLCGAFTVAANGSMQDRWFRYTTGSMVLTSQQAAVAVPIPGTDFLISQFAHRTQVQTPQASLAAGDYFQIAQTIEGPNHREMSGAHSVSLLVRSSVANLKFSLVLSDPSSSLSLVKLCNAGTVGVWNLIQLPNLPVMTGGGFSATPGVAGHILHIVLACGTTYMAPAADVWQNGNFLGAPGMDNFASNAANSTFDIAFVQHEPGPLCTTLIDKPFSQNYDECLRYYQKSYSYATAIGTSGSVPGYLNGLVASIANYIVGFAGFTKPMAKVPTAVLYDMSNGVINNLYNNSSGAHVVVSSAPASEKSIMYAYVSTAQTAGQWLSAHYTADTGW